MSMLVRKPTQRDVRLGSKHAEVAVFEPFDYNHVREKYPKADDALLKRLGSAITCRRKHMKYRERHAMKLMQGIDNVDPRARDIQNVHESETMKEGTTSVLTDTVATDFHPRNIDFGHNASDTGLSQTSYAPTLLSGGHVTIPSPPKSSLGGMPFECPYCFYLITVHSTRSWNKHVFQDLQPYVCTALNCAFPDKLYSTRHEWLHHSKMAHLTATTDGDTIGEHENDAACPFCKEKTEPGKQYNRHLARHLQELALFILPGNEEESEVSEDHDTESTSSAESMNIAKSHDRPKSPDGLPASPVEHPAANEGPYWKEDSAENGKKQNDLWSQLRERENELGPEHPNTLHSMHNLAITYSDAGERQNALQLLETVVVAREKMLGEEHADTLRSMHNLAIRYSEAGEVQKALQLLERVVEVNQRTLGEEHADRLTSQYALAIAYQANGEFSKAVELLEHVVAVRKEVFAEDHPDRLVSQHALRNSYAQQSSNKERTGIK